MTTNRRLFATILQALLPVIAAGALFAGGASTMEYSPLHDMGVNPISKENYDQNIAPSKPRNEWGAKDMAKAGFAGCVPTGRVAEEGPYPTSHMVRLPIAEGWRWVRMTPAEVAHRMEGFGGTPSTKDDVKVVGDCY